MCLDYCNYNCHNHHTYSTSFLWINWIVEHLYLVIKIIVNYFYYLFSFLLDNMNLLNIIILYRMYNLVLSGPTNYGAPNYDITTYHTSFLFSFIRRSQFFYWCSINNYTWKVEMWTAQIFCQNNGIFATYFTVADLIYRYI